MLNGQPVGGTTFLAVGRARSSGFAAIRSLALWLPGLLAASISSNAVFTILYVVFGQQTSAKMRLPAVRVDVSVNRVKN